MLQFEQFWSQLSIYTCYIGHGIWDLLIAFKTLLLVFGPAIGAVLLAAYLASRWQLRNWIYQQRIADSEKLNSETKNLFDDLVSLASKRLFKTRRLFWALQGGDPEKIERARISYDETLTDWNESELSWNVRFVKNMPNGTDFLGRINEKIRVPFVELGRKLESYIRKANGSGVDATAVFSEIESKRFNLTLNSLSKAIFEISRDIYGKLDYLNTARLDEDQFIKGQLNKQKFEELSVRQLFKSVLTSNKNSQFY